MRFASEVSKTTEYAQKGYLEYNLLAEYVRKTETAIEQAAKDGKYYTSVQFYANSYSALEQLGRELQMMGYGISINHRIGKIYINWENAV